MKLVGTFLCEGYEQEDETVPSDHSAFSQIPSTKLPIRLKKKGPGQHGISCNQSQFVFHIPATSPNFNNIMLIVLFDRYWCTTYCFSIIRTCFQVNCLENVSLKIGVNKQGRLRKVIYA